MIPQNLFRFRRPPGARALAALLGDYFRKRRRSRSRSKVSRVSPPAARTLLFEALEPRILLSADLNPMGSTALTSPGFYEAVTMAAGQQPGPQVDMTTQANSAHLDGAIQPSGIFGSLEYSIMPGSGIHRTLAFGDITEGATDSFAVALEAGFPTTLIVKPNDANFVGSFEILDPNGVQLGQSSSSAPGASMFFELLDTAEAGTYTVNLTSDTGSTGYEINLYTGAVPERDFYGEVLAETPEDAAELANWIPLPGGGERIGAIGRGGNGDFDYFSFEATAGDTISGIFSGWPGEVVFNLLDSEGTRLATSAQSLLRDFVIEDTGTYFIEVKSVSTTPFEYSFGLAREAGMIWNSQTAPMSSTGAMLSHVGFSGGEIRVAVLDDPGNNAELLVGQLNDDTYFNFEADLVTAAELADWNNLWNYQVVMLGALPPPPVIIGSTDLDSGMLETAAVDVDYSIFSSTLRDWVYSGGALVATSYILQDIAEADGGNGNFELQDILPVTLQTLPTGGFLQPEGVHPIVDGIDPFQMGGEQHDGAVAKQGSTILARLNEGEPGVVIGNVGNGRSVYLAPAYLGESSAALRAGEADQLLEQAVAWAAQPSEKYLVRANAGDVITVTTQTPNDAPGAPFSELDLRVTVYAQDGTIVAFDDNSAADGHNVALTFTAATAGTYRVDVQRVTNGMGDYIVRVDGATGEEEDFRVEGTWPFDDQVTTTPFTEFEVNFTAAILLTSLSAGDFTLNGVAATSMEILDGARVKFSLIGLANGEGDFVAEIAAGAITSIDGRAFAGMSANYRFDQTPPKIVSTSIAPGGLTESSGTVVYSATLSEDIRADWLNAGAATLHNIGTGQSLTAVSFTYDEPTRTVSFTFEGVSDGNQEIRLFNGAFRDAAYFALDGNGDGNQFDDYVSTFDVDNTGVRALSPLVPNVPDGSQVYSRILTGTLGGLDTSADEFTVDIAGGQKISVVLTPSGLGDLLGQIEILDTNGTVVATGTASAVDRPAAIQDFSVASTGTYKVRLTALSGSAAYDLQLALNAAAEAEGPAGSNDALAGARDIDGSLRNFGGTSERLAVLGRLAGASDNDTFSFTLAAGQELELAVRGVDGIAVDLLDSSGNLITRSIQEAGGGSIRGFIASAAGTYYARVSGPDASAYSLTVLRDAQLEAFGRELHDGVALGRIHEFETFNTYYVRLEAGNTFTITTSVPGLGAGEPFNSFDPFLAAYETDDPFEAPFAIDYNSVDGRNATLSFVASHIGTYRVIVFAEGGSGDYALHVDGTSPMASALSVVSTTPEPDALVGEFPGQYDVHFSAGIDFATVSASDLTVNGQAASAVTMVDGDTLRFTVTDAAAGDGIYDIAVAAGALAGLDGALVGAFATTFDLDDTSPIVTASSLAGGEVINAGEPFVFTVTFNEDIGGLDADDIALRNNETFGTIAPTDFQYDSGTRTATVTFAVVPEGEYELQLNGDTITDLRGNALDGDGDGNEGGEFQRTFVADITLAPFPPLVVRPPLGSMIYSASVNADIGETGDVDEFSLAIAAGQTVHVQVMPGTVEHGLNAQIDLVDQNDTIVATAMTESGRATLTATNVAAGTYRVRVTSFNGVDSLYRVQVALNAIFETESLGNNNNAPERAVALDAWSTLAGTGVDRMGALGRFATSTTTDYYAFDLTAGQRVSVALQLLNGSTEGLTLALEDAAGNVLTFGTGFLNADAGISNFVATAAGRYYLRLEGQSDAEYSLVVARDADFGFETGAPQAATANTILAGLGTAAVAPPDDVVGSVDGWPLVLTDGAGYRWDIFGSGFIDDGERDAFNGGLNLSGFDYFNSGLLEGGGREIVLGTANFDGVEVVRKIFVSPTEGFIRYLEIATNTNSDERTHWLQLYSGLGSGDQTIVAGTSDDNDSFDTSDDWVVTDDAADQDDPAVAHIVSGAEAPVRTGYAGVSNDFVDYGYELTLAPGETRAVMHFAVQRDGRADAIELARRIAALDPSLGLLDHMSDAERGQLANFEPGDAIDEYTFEGAEGALIEIETETPGDGGGQPDNMLDVALVLIDPNGNVVATDEDSADGRNALIDYTIPTGEAGTYTVRVIQRGDASGAYVLRINGADLADVAPVVTGVSPGNNGVVGTPPTSITFSFSEGLLLSSVQASDLEIYNGATVESVELLDGSTVRFNLSVPDVDAVFGYRLLAGSISDLQGNTLADDYEGEFILDRAAPQVTGHTPSEDDAPLFDIHFFFSEPMDASTFSASDVIAFTGPNGEDLLGAIWQVQLVGDGSTAAVRFNSQLTEGTYTMTLGSDIRDRAGNELESGYTATVEVSARDLEVTSVTVENGAEFGQQVTVTWTVVNDGAVAISGSWQDRIYLSADENLTGSDAVIWSQNANASPLAPGASYTRSATFNLPLLAAFSTGSYRFFVRTDALGGISEGDENNNVGMSAAHAIAVPPVADLAPSEIGFPETATSGDTITVSYTVTNSGDATATGTWYDEVYLATDAAGNNRTYIGFIYVSGPLDPGQSVTVSKDFTLPFVLEGERWIVVRSNVGGTPYEHTDTANNTLVSVTSMTVTQRLLPNLEVTAITPPSDAFSGQTYNVSWTVTNTGPGAAAQPFWYDRIYLSSDPNLSGFDTYLGQATKPNDLAPGASYTSSVNVTLPKGLSGTYYLIVVTDAGSTVDEDSGGQGDNSRAQSFAVTLTPPPNLVVTEVDAPDEAFSGAPMTLEWTVANIGSGATDLADWYDQIVMSSDTIFGNGDDVTLEYVAHDGVLAVGGTYDASAQVSLPIGRSGPHYFFVVTDTFNEIYEHGNEGDNRTRDEQVTTVSLTPPPDLTAEILEFPATVRANDLVSFTYRVTNSGERETPESFWRDYLGLSLNGSAVASVVIDHFGALAAGASYTGTATIRVPQSADGSAYKFFATTDSASDVFELDNGNNTGESGSVTVQNHPSNLVTAAVTTAGNGIAGQSFHVDWTVQNTGTNPTNLSSWSDYIILSSDNTAGNADDVQLMNVGHSGVLAVGGQYSGSADVTLPYDFAEGSYRIFVWSDRLDAEYETDNSDNIKSSDAFNLVQQTPNLQVAPGSISAPAEALSGGRIPVTWTITNTGDAPVSGWLDAVYLATDQVGGGDIHLGNFQFDGVLQPGQSVARTVQVDLPLTTSGTFYFYVLTDAANQHFEYQGEGNNDRFSAATTHIELRPFANLQVTDITPPLDAASSQPTEIVWQVTNTGTGATSAPVWYDSVYLSLDGVIDSGDVLLGTVENASYLGVNESYVNRLTATLPRGIQGDYRIIARTDTHNNVFEHLGEGDNTRVTDPVPVALTPPPNLRVTDVTAPPSAFSGQPMDLSFTVTNDGEGSHLRDLVD